MFALPISLKSFQIFLPTAPTIKHKYSSMLFRC